MKSIAARSLNGDCESTLSRRYENSGVAVNFELEKEGANRRDGEKERGLENEEERSKLIAPV